LCGFFLCLGGKKGANGPTVVVEALLVVAADEALLVAVADVLGLVAGAFELLVLVGGAVELLGLVAGVVELVALGGAATDEEPPLVTTVVDVAPLGVALRVGALLPCVVDTLWLVMQ
jgi:hypothetical protein